MNSVILIGRLTATPEFKHSQYGTPFTTFTVAVQDNFKDKKKCNFINCTAWRNTAAFISKYFVKGQEIAVEGRIETDNYTTKTGEKRTNVQVQVAQAHFVGSSSTKHEEIPTVGSYSNMTDEELIDYESEEFY